MSVNDGSQLQTYQNVLCLNIFFLQPWSWKFFIKEIIHRGKNTNATLKIYVYTNKSTKFGVRNDTLAASEVSIFAKHLLQVESENVKTCLSIKTERGTCFL